ncbi:hypothetical protein GGR53DRAFT_347417 [Hypoxylon sp. FL1150]|nr:hypothetical protein GGR53DRAFT_347417 [Hypoxylon sp. FL1150]
MGPGEVYLSINLLAPVLISVSQAITLFPNLYTATDIQLESNGSRIILVSMFNTQLIHTKRETYHVTTGARPHVGHPFSLVTLNSRPSSYRISFFHCASY